MKKRYTKQAPIVLGEFIKDVRLMRDIPRNAMCEICREWPSAISRTERGLSDSLSVFCVMAYKLQCDPKTLGEAVMIAGKAELKKRKELYGSTQFYQG